MRTREELETELLHKSREIDLLKYALKHLEDAQPVDTKTAKYYVEAGYRSKWFSSRDAAKLYGLQTGGKVLARI